MEVVPGKGARMCECRVVKLREQRLAKIPAKFAGIELMNLKPMPNLHPFQSEIVPYMQNNPTKSYFLAGKFGTGKSTLMWALYQHLVTAGVGRIIVCTLSELLNEYKAFIQASISGDQPKYPRLNAEELRQNHTRYAIFFDDVDKAKPTEYAAEQFFEIVNAIYDFQHQVVITTNLGVAKLADHFDRADERFGGAIVRRLVDNARIVEMF